MQNKKLYKKLFTILDWFILLLPLIVLFINFLGIAWSSMTTGVSPNLFIRFNDLNSSCYSWLYNCPVFTCFSNLFKILCDLPSSTNFLSYPLLLFITSYLTYIVLISLIIMVRNLLLLIPTWFNNMLD